MWIQGNKNKTQVDFHLFDIRKLNKPWLWVLACRNININEGNNSVEINWNSQDNKASMYQTRNTKQQNTLGRLRTHS